MAARELKVWRKLGCAAAIAGILFLSGPVPQAQAGIWNWITGISEVPSEVEQLKSKYDEIEQTLTNTQQTLSNTQKEYQTLTSQLNAENAALKEQNEQLSKRILLLEEQEMKQKLRTKRITTTVLTGAGLLLLYFALTRVMRVIVWRRHGSS
ncbi:hypothetical protein [Paenibacillus marinisediminis]